MRSIAGLLAVMCVFGLLVQPSAAAQETTLVQVAPADRLMGLNIKNRRGEKLGKLDNIMIDLTNGVIAYGVMDTGLMGNLLAVPWDALTLKLDEKTATLDVDTEMLQSAPGFGRARWPDSVERQWLADVYTYYGYPSHPGLTVVTVEKVPVARATTLVGMKVRNPQRENLGEIENLMIDLVGGRVAYAVFDTGGFLGLGKKLRAVPWKAMTLEPIERVVVLALDKEKLQHAPTIQKSRSTEAADRHWLSQVYAYYGAEPYWEKM